MLKIVQTQEETVEYRVTDKPEAPEGDTYADTVILDSAGIDLHYDNGEVHSANWGEHLPEDIATTILWDAFKESPKLDREMILEHMQQFVAKLERNIGAS